MPTVTDSLIYSGSLMNLHTQSRPIILSNGWIVVGVLDNGSARLNIMVSKDKGATFQLLAYLTSVRNSYPFAIVNKGTDIFLFWSTTGSYAVYMIGIDALTVTLGANVTTNQIHVANTNTNDARGISAVIENDVLHLVFSQISTSFTSSANICYRKGTISGLTINWTISVTHLTGSNTSNVHNQYPEIITLGNGKLLVVYNYISTNPYQIRALQFDGTNWTTFGNHITIYDSANANVTQWIPTVTYVSPETSGLSQGRVWVSWHGRDAVESTRHNIRVSYSDNLGLNWSNMEKLTVTGADNYDRERPSITVTKTNEILILYFKYASGVTNKDICMLKWKNGSWSAETIVKTYATSNTSLNPSTIYNPNFNMSLPLFAYREIDTIRFSGNWTVTNISILPKDLGAKTIEDLPNFFAYTITNADEMQPIVEKINDVTIATKTASSGQPQIVSLTKEQWNNIKFGKGKSVLGGVNTLTIQMGIDIFEYPFNKQLSTESKIDEVIMAVSDIEDTFLPFIKQMLINKIGGQLTDSFEAIIKNGAYGKKYSTATFIQPANANQWIISNLGFIPRYIIGWDVNGANTIYNADKQSNNTLNVYNGAISFSQTTPFTSDSFTLNRGYASASTVSTSYIAFA